MPRVGAKLEQKWSLRDDRFACLFILEGPNGNNFVIGFI